MKYLTCYFFICTIGYISATAVNLQDLLGSSNADSCACRASLQEMYRQVSNNLQSLKDIENVLVNVDATFDNINETISNQVDSLSKLEDDLSVIIDNENSTSTDLNKQTVDLQGVFDDLCDVCENTECIEEIAEQQTCILESLQRVAEASLEDCNGANCQAQIGLPKP